MEVLQVAGLYPPHLGGEELVVQRLAEQQVRDGHTVTVLTSDTGLTRSTPRVANERGVSVKRLRSRTVAHTPLMPSLPAAILRHRPRPDVVHLHGGHAVIAEQVLGACAIRRIPFVVHVHLLVRPAGPVGEVLLPVYERTLMGRVLARAARVICLTETMRQELIKRHDLPDDQVVVVPNGIDLAVGSDLEERRTDELLFVGRLTRQKNIVTLVESMAGMPDVTLRVIGDGEQRPEVEHVIAALGLRNVVLEGRLGPDAVQAAYARATMLLMPSSHEGMPLVLLEAMAAGLPVIASDIPELREVGAGVVRHLTATTTDAIREEVHTLLADAATRAQMAEAGRRRARERDWASIAHVVEGLYRDAQSVNISA